MRDIDLSMDIDEEVVKDSEQNEETMEEESADPVAVEEPSDPGTAEESLINQDSSLTKPDEELKRELTEEPLPESDYKTKWVTK